MSKGIIYLHKHEETRKKISESKGKYDASQLKRKAYNRIDHIFKDGIEYKKCCRCLSEKQLFEFGKYHKTWDKLNRYCKECQKKNMRDYRKEFPEKKLSQEELKKSYKTRKTVSMPIIATDEKGNTIKFNSMMDAYRAGFRRNNIKEAIINNTEYKGYKWKYIEE